MGIFWHELLAAWRSLFRSPGISILSISMLAIGIGLCLFVYGALQSLVLEPPPFDRPEELVHFELGLESDPEDDSNISVHDLLDIRKSQTRLQSLEGYYEGTINISGDSRPERYDGAFLTANAFDVLGIKPLIGTGFPDGANLPGAEPVVLLGYSLWQNRFLGSADVLGQLINVNGQPTRVIGVMPQHMRFPRMHDIWVPASFDIAKVPRGDGTELTVFGRLKPGVDLAQVQQELSALVKQQSATYPGTVDGDSARVEKIADMFVGTHTRRILATMLVSVFLVLLIACANVANLLAVRAATRARETAIRSALGASRARLALNVLLESLLLSLFAGFFAFLLSNWAGELVGAIMASSDDSPPYWKVQVVVNGWDAVKALLISFVAALAAAAMPAWRLLRSSTSQVMRESGHGTAAGIGKLGKILVTAEIAMSVALMAAAGLLVRSTLAMTDIDLGVNSEQVITGRLGLFNSQYPEDADVLRMQNRLLTRLQSTPGVESAALSSGLPLGPANQENFWPEGFEATSNDQLPDAFGHAITPDYFQVFKIRQIEGRTFFEQDTVDGQKVIIVAQALAQRFWPNQSAIGKRVRLAEIDDVDAPWRVVVGVVGDVLQTPQLPQTSTYYLPMSQAPTRFMSLLVRTKGPADAFINAMKSAVEAEDSNLPIYWVRSLEDWIKVQTFDLRLISWIFSAFGIMALILSGAGIYAVLAFGVAQRTREIGVRRVLGAEDRSILKMVLQQGLTQLAIGLIFGLIGAWLFGQALMAVLFEVSPFDPWVLLLVCLVLLLAVVAASVIPTLRALRVEPMEALRYE